MAAEQRQGAPSECSLKQGSVCRISDQGVDIELFSKAVSKYLARWEYTDIAAFDQKIQEGLQLMRLSSGIAQL
jgi:hypothetical protein